MVNDFSAENGESLRDDSFYVPFNRFLESFRLMIGNDWVQPITLKKSGDFSFEINDVLIGPI